MKGKKIILGITGSIAAYKALLLIRQLVKAGAEVRCVMTPAAGDFITPLSVSTLSKNRVLTGLKDDETWNNHVELGRWADLMIIAPLSCNTLARMAGGLCDNLLLAVYLSARCPVIVAPAMDEDMWKHPATVLNLERLAAHGVQVISVGSGELASGLFGEGRMAEPEEIMQSLSRLLTPKRDLEGRRILVTAGPTHEPLDPVRFIGNRSSGKMGVALAAELAGRGALVDLVLGPSALEINDPGILLHRVESAQEMYERSLQLFPGADAAVMAAAVADYAPAEFRDEKIKKDTDTITLELKKTKDILETLGQLKKPGQILVGFALEKSNERNYAIGKLERKNADMIVLNSLNDEGAGFGTDTNKITIFERGGRETAFEKKPKQQVAKDIVDRLIKLLYDK